MTSPDISELATKVKFDPRESCTFTPNHEKQMVDLVIKNETGLTIITKLKSNRLKHYKMKPVFALLRPGEKKSVKLVFKGFPKGEYSKPSKHDHFSVVYSVPPEGTINNDPKIIWKEPDTKQSLSTQGVYKKRIKIKYAGLNDKDPDIPTQPELIIDKAQLAKILREQQKKPPEPLVDAPPLVGPPGAGEQPREGEAPVVYLVYNKREEEEEEEEEEEDDEEGENEKKPPHPKK